MKKLILPLLVLALAALTTPAQADCGAGQPPAGTVCAAPPSSAGVSNYRLLTNPHIPAGIDAAKVGGGSVSTTEYDRLNGITVFGQSLIDDADATAGRVTLGVVIGANVQAFDADLTTWAGLTPSANAQSLVSAASYAAMRALLDLEAGTDFYSIAAANAAFQPLDADLTTWAGLTPSANAQSLVTAANYASMRALLDLEAGTDFYSISGANAAFQPLDADLTTWAGLTPSANAQSLVTAANYASMRALLDLEAGTDFYSIAAANAAFQPIDADLTTWAGITRSSGFDTWTATASSANLRSLMTNEVGTGNLMFGLHADMNDDLSCTASQFVRRNGADTLWECATIAGGGNALTSSPLSQFAATTSAQLRGVMSDEEGTGNLLFGLTTTMQDGLSCGASQSVKRNSADTAFECSDIVSSSTTVLGIIETATTAEAAAQTDTSRAITPQGLAFKPESLCIALSDETTDLTTGTNKATWRMPYAFTLTTARASVNDAAAGTLITVDINEGGSTIMTTNKLTIDIGELTSVTAATAVGITDSTLASDAAMSADIDGVGTTAKGLKICLIGHQ